MPRLANADTWERRALRRLPRVAFDFITGGAEDEVTLRRNRAAFDDLCLIPRVLGGVDAVSTELDLFGQRLTLPVLLAPAGNALVAGPEGEVAQARGASAAGSISVLACASSIPTEQVAGSVEEPQWFQIYLYRDRDRTLEAVDQAKRLGFSALVLTADAPVSGGRERDLRNGLRVPIKITPRMLPTALLRPRWMWHYWTGEPMAAHFVPNALTGPDGQRSLEEYVGTLFDSRQTWDDLRWLRTVWDGPLLLKGVMCAEDADRALDAGCDGVIVSNHGGRQLDAAPATIEVLPEVVAAVDGRAVVLMDGGIRRGTDVVKALSLGATACLVGRPWWYGLAVGGAAGVTQVLDGLRTEIARAMHLLGASELGQLGPELVRRRPGSGWLPGHPKEGPPDAMD